MAEVALQMLLNKERPGGAEVISSGIAAANGFPATMYAIEAAEIWKCDLDDHGSQQLTPELIEQSDLILAMAPEHLDEIIRLVPRAKGKSYLFKNFPDPAVDGEMVDDPIGQSKEIYNETFLEIGEYLGKHLPEIVKRIDAKSNA